MKSKPYLSIVLPSYNEQENIEQGVISEMMEYLNAVEYSWEVIFSDDGSTDNTKKLLKKIVKSDDRMRLLENPHRGKGPTVRAGMTLATGKYRLFTDFDQATPIAEVEKLLPFMKKQYEIAIGSREVHGSQRDKEPFYRHIMGKTFNVLVQLLTIPGIWDTQCGFKLFNGSVVDQLFNSLKVYGGNSELDAAFTGAFDVELLFIAKKRGMKIAEVPVLWKHVKSNRVNPIRDSYRMFIDLLRIRKADLKGLYDQKQA